MKTLIEKLMVPNVTVGSVKVAASSVSIVERPLAPVGIEIDFPAPHSAGKPHPGAAVQLSVGETTVEGRVQNPRLMGTTIGETVTFTAVLPSAAWHPTTVHFHKKKRAYCLRALLPGMPLVEKSDPSGNEEHGRLTLLSEQSCFVAARLALFGTQVLLNSLAGAVLVRPDQAVAARLLPDDAFFMREQRSAPGLSLVAPSPKEWGRVLKHHRKPPGPDADQYLVHLGEAVSVAELKAAGTALWAVEALGSFEAHGGPELLDIGPGDWIADSLGVNFLVTGRTRTWTQGTGWRVELRGGYPWGEMIHDAVLPSEPAEVVGFDEESGLLKVRLPFHENVEIAVFQRADRGGVGSYKLTMPAVGEFGTVQFAHGPDHAIYLGASAPTGVVTKKDFDDTVDVLQTEGSSERRRKDGTVEFVWKEFMSVCKGMMTYVAQKYEFKKG